MNDRPIIMFTFTGVCYCRLTWQPSNNHSAFPCIIKIFDPAHEALCHVSFYPSIKSFVKSGNLGYIITLRFYLCIICFDYPQLR